MYPAHAGQFFLSVYFMRFCQVLPKSDDFPPGSTNRQIDERGDGRHDKTIAPPFSLRDVAGAVVNRGAAIAVMREGNRDVGENAEDDGRHERRGTDGDGDSDECSVESADAGRDAGEAVVNVGVEEKQDESRSDPAEAERGNCSTCGTCHPFDDAGFGKSRGQSHERAHPEHRIPSTFFAKDIFPVDNVENNHDADSGHGDRRSTDMRETGSSPEEQRAEEDSGQIFFAARHRAHGCEFFLGELFGIGDADEFRFRQFEHDERDEQQAQKARYDSGAGPAHPSNLNAESFGGEGYAERVAGHGRHEHRTGHGIAVIADLHEIGTDFLRGFVRLRAERAGEGTDNRVHDAAAAGRGRWRGRGNNEFTESDGIAKGQCTFADGFDDTEGDAFAETALDEAARIKEGTDNEPDCGIAVTRESVADF